MKNLVIVIGASVTILLILLITLLPFLCFIGIFYSLWVGEPMKAIAFTIVGVAVFINSNIK